jgi:outer membrane protein insertion porin family
MRAVVSGGMWRGLAVAVVSRGARRALAFGAVFAAATLFASVAACASAFAGAAQADEPLRWGKLRLVASAPIDSVAWGRVLDLEGRPVSDAPIGPALRRALAWLSEAGYPFAEASPGSFDLRDGRLEGTVTLDMGPMARVAGLLLPGGRVTRPATALRVAGVRIGEPYTGRQDRALAEALARSGLFLSVGEVKLSPGGVPDDVLLEVPVTEPPYTRFAGVLGVSGRDSRVTGLVDLDLANIAGTARRATGRWEDRGEGLSRFALSYHEPWLPLVPVGVQGSLAHDVNRSVYSYTKWELAASLDRPGGWRFQVGRGGTRAVETASDLGAISEGFYLVGVEWDRRNSLLVPTAGGRLFLESRRGQKSYTVARDSLDVRIDRTRWTAGAEAYRRAGRQWLLALRGSFEYLDTPEDSLARYDLFAVGGASSLRGYREEQFLTPGAWIVQAEWRWLADARGSALYLFTDAAFISPRRGQELRDSFRTFLLGTGVGVRQASKLGLLGIEYGVAKGESPLDGRIHLRLDAAF